MQRLRPGRRIFYHSARFFYERIPRCAHTFYFGLWNDPEAAEAKWERDQRAIIEGRDPDHPVTCDCPEWLAERHSERSTTTALPASNFGLLRQESADRFPSR